MPGAECVTLFLSGDVMTGRGIDQILPHSVDPILYERDIRTATRYVELAERTNGSIPRIATPEYIWGEALDTIRAVPDLRIVNLETAVTASSAYWQEKGIHYRMHPKNVSCLTSAQIDCCVLANNHVLDWGYAGLDETLHTLTKAELNPIGAGENLAAARRPATFKLPEGRRILVFGVGSPSSGIPDQWRATQSRPGVHLVDETDPESISALRSTIERWAKPDDLVIVSIHWGPNWGYEIPEHQRALAHTLIEDTGVDLVHGHSSHHVKGVEFYRDRPILYGCGDFLTDYEGIGGPKEYRDDLGLMYVAHFHREPRTLPRLEMHPTQIRKFHLTRPSSSDVDWVAETVQRESQHLDTNVRRERDRLLVAG